MLVKPFFVELADSAKCPCSSGNSALRSNFTFSAFLFAHNIFSWIYLFHFLFELYYLLILLWVIYLMFYLILFSLRLALLPSSISWHNLTKNLVKLRTLILLLFQSLSMYLSYIYNPTNIKITKYKISIICFLIFGRLTLVFHLFCRVVLQFLSWYIIYCIFVNVSSKK